MLTSLVITLPCMGKTTLCRSQRPSNWDKSPILDYDVKGFHFEDAHAETAAQMARLAEKRVVLTFNGMHLKYMPAEVSTLFVIPAPTEMPWLRSMRRGDSVAFTQSYRDNLRNWVDGLFTSAMLRISQLAESGLGNHTDVLVLGKGEFLGDRLKLRFSEDKSAPARLQCHCTLLEKINISTNAGEALDALTQARNSWMEAYDAEISKYERPDVARKLAHIQHVNAMMKDIAAALSKRGSIHDADKLEALVTGDLSLMADHVQQPHHALNIKSRYSDCDIVDFAEIICDFAMSARYEGNGDMPMIHSSKYASKLYAVNLLIHTAQNFAQFDGDLVYLPDVFN